MTGTVFSTWGALAGLAVAIVLSLDLLADAFAAMKNQSRNLCRDTEICECEFRREDRK